MSWGKPLGHKTRTEKQNVSEVWVGLTEENKTACRQILVTKKEVSWKKQYLKSVSENQTQTHFPFTYQWNSIKKKTTKKKCPCFGICKGNILLKLKTIKPPYWLVLVNSGLREMLVFLWEEN